MTTAAINIGKFTGRLQVTECSMHYTISSKRKLVMTAKGRFEVSGMGCDIKSDWTYENGHKILKLENPTIWPKDVDQLTRRHIALTIKKNIKQEVRAAMRIALDKII